MASYETSFSSGVPGYSLNDSKGSYDLVGMDSYQKMNGRSGGRVNYSAGLSARYSVKVFDNHYSKKAR